MKYKAIINHVVLHNIEPTFVPIKKRKTLKLKRREKCFRNFQLHDYSNC